MLSINAAPIRRYLLIAALAFASFAAPAHADGERDAVQRLNDALLGVMQRGPELGFEGRRAELEPVLRDLFDFRLMTQIGLQRHWANLSETQRTAIADAFADMSIATFASRFDDHGGERFEIEGEKPGPRDLVLVQTAIHRPDREKVGLTYVMRDGPDGPRIIDVLAQGRFSELARQRAEMSSVFGREGADGLIASLRAKARELAAE
jgi:phospholipid transport system substrate-binding protein